MTDPQSTPKSEPLRVVQARVADLKLHPRNPRTIFENRLAQLTRTIAAHPDLLEARPLIALPDGTVIAGNMRLRAVQQLGWKLVPTVFADLDESEALEWAFLDNRSFGEDDPDIAGELLAELQARGGNLDLTGFERHETDALLRRLVQRDRDPDEVVPLPKSEPVSQLGDVYQLGPHRIMCGDSTNPEHVSELLANEHPILIATDPPYGVNLDNGWRDRAGLNSRRRPPQAGGRRAGGLDDHAATTIQADDRSDWADAYALVPSCSVAYIWHASTFSCKVQAGLERIGFQVAQQIIWAKPAFALSRAHYNWAHEPCLYARRAGARVPWLGPRNLSTVWQVASPKMVMSGHRGPGDVRVDHPTQKPVLLFARPIENHLQPGESLYDPFAGSGTALIAAEQTGRRCLAMEIDPRFVDLIRERYRRFSDVG